jgi:hypothetical protein
MIILQVIEPAQPRQPISIGIRFAIVDNDVRSGMGIDRVDYRLSIFHSLVIKRGGSNSYHIFRQLFLLSIQPLDRLLDTG